MKWFFILLLSLSAFSNSFNLNVEIKKNGETITSPKLLLEDGKTLKPKTLDDSSLSMKLTSDGDALKLNVNLLSNDSLYNPEILLFVEDEVEYETTNPKTGDVVTIKVSASRQQSTTL